MVVATMSDLFHDLLKDVYYAEKQPLKALPKMAKESANEDLAGAFTSHLAETEGQIERLEKVFEMIGETPRGKKCEAMEGLVAEGEEVIEHVEDKALKDVGLIGAAQAVEHYEIARYGTLIAWAETLGLTDAVPLLEETLDEEKAADEKLTELAGMANETAKKAGEESERTREAAM